MPLSTNTNLPPIYIRTRIPKTYERRPIISRLISCYGLTINIVAALLGTSYRNDGWCDLELLGSSQQVEAGLTYLQQLNIEVFHLTLKSVLEARIKKSQTEGIISDSEVSPSIEQMHTITENEPQNDLTVGEEQTTQTKVHVCIPKNYRAQPVIAGLVSRYGLTVNIISAFLGADAQDDGWFDLEIWGNRRQILLCRRYLVQLGLAPRYT